MFLGEKAKFCAFIAIGTGKGSFVIQLRDWKVSTGFLKQRESRYFLSLDYLLNS